MKIDETLLRKYIRAVLNEEVRDRMMMGTIAFTAPERAEFNDDDDGRFLGTPDAIDDSDAVGPVPPENEEPRVYKDPYTSDYLTYSSTTMR